MELLDRIRASQEDCNVLRHPFYERWSSGALTAHELAVYASEYRHAVVALADAAATAATLDGDEGHAAEEAAHVALWDDFARAVGGDTQREPLPRTQACASAWAQDDAWAATGVLLAIEGAQPPIAATKLAGLVEHYGVAEGAPALEYFRVHAERDHEHAARAAELLERAPADAHDRIAGAADAALRANWLLLDGVDAVA